MSLISKAFLPDSIFARDSHEHVLKTIQSSVKGKKGEAYTRGLIRAVRVLRKQLEENPRLPYQKGPA